MPIDAARYSDVQLTLCLTHDCNLDCRYCYGGAKSARHMTRDTAERAIDFAVARGTERLHLVFFGGEPLLRWDELQVLTDLARDRAAAAGLELRPTVTTNGTLLTDPRVAWLGREGFVLAVSCDGNERAHDANRRDPRGQGSYAQTAAGLRRALAAGLAVRTVLVIDPSTVAELPRSVESLWALGAHDLVVNPNWSADWSDDAVRGTWADAYRAVAQRYVEAYRDDRPFWISLIDPKIAAHIKGGYAPEERCDLGRRNLVVAPSGRLYPCDRLVGEDRDERYVIGDVDRGVLAERVAELATRCGELPGDCLRCAIADRCRNRCLCANVALSGAVDQPSETLCFHEQLCIRIADGAAKQLCDERNPSFLRRHYGSELH